MGLCDACELCTTAQNPCTMGTGSKKARVMFIQDCPNELDDMRALPFYGKTCNNFRHELINEGIDIDDVYFTSLVKCPAPGEEPKPPHIAACKDLIDAEVKTVDPDIIVPMGNKSLRYCTGYVGLSKVRGNAQEVDLLGRTRIILPTMHPRSANVKPLYKEYILKDLETLKNLYDNGMTKVTGVNYRSLETVEDVRAEVKRMEAEAKIICFDLETTGKSAFMDYSKIVCISLTDKTHQGVVIPLYHHESPFKGEALKEVMGLVKEILETDIPKVAHNGKFDIEWLYWWAGIDVKNFSFDTMLAHYLCISEEQGTQGLKGQAWEFTDMGGYDNALDEERKKLPEAIRYNYDNIPWKVLSNYAVADVDCCLRLWEIYKPMIDDNPKWATVMSDIMMPASYALRNVEGNGMKFDVELSKKYLKTYQDEIDRITERLESFPEVIQLEREKRQLFQEREKIRLIPRKDRTPEEQKKFEKYKKYKDYKFSWTSPKQLAELLYERCGLEPPVMTDTGAPSTGEEAMIALKDKHEIPDLLLELRKVTTLMGMFIQKLPEMRDENDIVHPSFNISGCITGNSLIPTSEGLQRIKDIIGQTEDGQFLDKQVQIVNRYGQLENTSKIVRYTNRETVRVTTILGFQIEGTLNHPIIVNHWNKRQITYNGSTKAKDKLEESREWKELQDVTDLDLIAIPYGYNMYGNKPYYLNVEPVNVYKANRKQGVTCPKELNEDLAEFLGMYYADGTVKSENGTWSISIINKDPDVIKRVDELTYKLFNLHTKVHSDSRTKYSVLCSIALQPLGEVLQIQRGYLNKTIPQFILNASKPIQIAYLRGMTLDGCYSHETLKHCFRYCFAREDVARTVQLMLLNMGIVSCYRHGSSENSFDVTVYNYEYCKFRDTVGFVQSKKADYAFDCSEPCRKTNYFNDSEHNTLWLRVKSIEKSIADVYDFTVPGTHSFISNGFISHNTVTGRMSSENPNAQQFPRKAENPLLFQYHNEPKALFTTRYGKDGCIMNADYAALEMRIAAIISKDQTLLKAFLSGADLHKSTASLVWGMPIEEVDKDTRTKAKSVYCM